MYLNSVQQMVSGELAGEGFQTGFSRHGLPPQRPPLDTAYRLREHLNSVQRMVSGGYCEGLFPDTVCWTRLRNTWPIPGATLGITFTKLLVFGVPKPVCFKPGCLQFLRRSALLCSFAVLRLRPFALICTHSRVSAADRV